MPSACPLHALLHGAIIGAMKTALFATHSLSPRAAMRVGLALGGAASSLVPWRWKLEKTVCLALGLQHFPGNFVQHYFRNLSTCLGWSLAIYHHGFWNSGIPENISFHHSVGHLDEALSRGRGAVLVSGHQFCHEMAAAYISRRTGISVLC